MLRKFAFILIMIQLVGCSSEATYKSYLNKPENRAASALVAGEPKFNYPPNVVFKTIVMVCKKDSSIEKCKKTKNLSDLNMQVVMDMSEQLKAKFTTQQLENFEKNCGIVKYHSLEAIIKDHPECGEFFKITDEIGKSLVNKYTSK